MSVIHSNCAGLGCKAALIFGTARYRTLRSMEISRAGRVKTTRPVHSRRDASRGAGISSFPAPGRPVVPPFKGASAGTWPRLGSSTCAPRSADVSSGRQRPGELARRVFSPDPRLGRSSPPGRLVDAFDQVVEPLITEITCLRSHELRLFHLVSAYIDSPSGRTTG